MSNAHHPKCPPQSAAARRYVYLYGAAREGAGSASAFAGGAAGGFVR